MSLLSVGFHILLGIAYYRGAIEDKIYKLKKKWKSKEFTGGRESYMLKMALITSVQLFVYEKNKILWENDFFFI